LPIAAVLAESIENFVDESIDEMAVDFIANRMKPPPFYQEEEKGERRGERREKEAQKESESEDEDDVVIFSAKKGSEKGKGRGGKYILRNDLYFRLVSAFRRKAKIRGRRRGKGRLSESRFYFVFLCE